MIPTHQGTEDRVVVWRSLMYVPVNVEKYVDKAHTRGADCILLDLEDSVPEAEKAHARTLVEASAAKVSRSGADVVVRINRPLDMAVRDLEASVCPGVRGIAVTKIASVSHVKLLDEFVGELEAKRGMTVGHTRFVVMVETADAFFHIDEIAKASPRIAALNLGTEDFALSVGMQPEPEAVFYPKMQTVFAARAAGVIPLGFIGSVAQFADRDLFRAMVRRSRSLGFEGAACIHPGQAKILNEEYSPSAGDVEHAERAIAGNEQAKKEGRGSFALDGKMIDVPIVIRAERLLARHAAIKGREEKKRAFASS